MSIYNTLQTAVSGMAAQASALSAIGDNVANANTTGYKDADIQFQTLLGDNATSTYDSGGVQSRVRYNVTGQGEFTASSSSTDLAIKGNGYFVVQTSGGGTALTRAGSFVPNANGDLINTAGFKLMGYSLTDGTYNTTTGSGTLEPVNVSTQTLAATPSSSGSLNVNLPSAATAVAAANLPSTNSASATYTDKTSLTAYDKIGTAVHLDVYMTKTAANTWEVSAYNAADAAGGGGFPYSSAALATQTVAFDPSSGKVASGGTLSVPVPNGNTVAIDMSSSTQLATDYTVTTATVNGTAPSKLSSVAVGIDGTVTAIYANGQANAIYKIPLANVQSPDQMSALSGNIYEPNSASGGMTINLANTGSLGEIDSGELENSTVDLATQLSNMIVAQRSYEANSKVLSTGSDMLSTIIQSIHN